MSGGNVSCDIVNKIENTQIDLKFYPDEIVENLKDSPLTADEIAGSILNNIIDSALDIATTTPDSEVKKYEETLKKSLATKMEINKSSSKDADKLYYPKAVGDITNNCPLHLNPSDGVCILERKMNELESQHPPSEHISRMPEKKSEEQSDVEGLGDYKKCPDSKIITPFDEDKVCHHPRTVEKKTRLTDLVKNSRQVISEYLKEDEETKRKQDEWEKMQESVLRIIELDESKTEERDNKPENIPLPESNDDDILSAPTARENLVDVELKRKDENTGGDVCTRMSCPRRKKENESKKEGGEATLTEEKKKKKKSLAARFFGLFRRSKGSYVNDSREKK